MLCKLEFTVNMLAVLAFPDAVSLSSARSQPFRDRSPLFLLPLTRLYAMSSTTAGDAQQPLLKLSDLSLNPAPSFPALPVEILPKIIKLALDDDDFSRRCITKLACGQVAKLWRDASEIGLEYLVNSTKKAGRLVAWLEGSGRGNDVLRLEVQMGESQIGHNKFSLLVLECCFMKSLKLKVQQVDGSRHATAPFGQTLASSVMACRGLETFSVNSGDMIMCHGFFQRYVSLLSSSPRAN